MTLIEAIKSRLPRRFRDSECSANQEWHTSGLYNANDVLSENWEIQEPTVTITRTQFWDAVDITERLFWPNPAAKELARHLGLEPDA